MLSLEYHWDMCALSICRQNAIRKKEVSKGLTIYSALREKNCFLFGSQIVHWKKQRKGFDPARIQFFKISSGVVLWIPKKQMKMTHLGQPQELDTSRHLANVFLIVQKSPIGWMSGARWHSQLWENNDSVSVQTQVLFPAIVWQLPSLNSSNPSRHANCWYLFLHCSLCILLCSAFGRVADRNASWYTGELRSKLFYMEVSFMNTSSSWTNNTLI